MTHPNGLEALLEQDEQAKRYFGSLPSYVQDLVSRSPEKIESGDQLRRSASGILDSLSR